MAENNQSVTVIAKLLDISPRRLQQLAADGIVPRAESGKYPLVGCVQGYIRFLRDRNIGDDIESGLDGRTERAKLNRSQRQKLDLEIAQMEDRLAPLDMITWVLNNVGSQIAAQLEAIPGRIKRRVPDLSVRHIEIIKGEIIKSQNLAARVTVDLDEYRASQGR